MGHSKLATTALYTKVCTRTIYAVSSLLDQSMALMEGKAQRRISRCVPISNSRTSSARPGRPIGQPMPGPEPRPVQGDVRNRDLPHGSPGAVTLRPAGIAGSGGSPTTVAATGTALMPGPRRVPGWPNGRPACYFHDVFTLPAEVSRHRLAEQGAALRSAVQGGAGDDADSHRQSPASGRPSITALLHTKWTPPVSIGCARMSCRRSNEGAVHKAS